MSRRDVSRLLLAWRRCRVDRYAHPLHGYQHAGSL